MTSTIFECQSGGDIILEASEVDLKHSSTKKRQKLSTNFSKVNKSLRS
jgi:hypothetical protein